LDQDAMVADGAGAGGGAVGGLTDADGIVLGKIGRNGEVIRIDRPKTIVAVAPHGPVFPYQYQYPSPTPPSTVGSQDNGDSGGGGGGAAAAAAAARALQGTLSSLPHVPSAVTAKNPNFVPAKNTLHKTKAKSSKTTRARSRSPRFTQRREKRCVKRVDALPAPAQADHPDTHSLPHYEPNGRPRLPRTNETPLGPPLVPQNGNFQTKKTPETDANFGKGVNNVLRRIALAPHPHRRHDRTGGLEMLAQTSRRHAARGYKNSAQQMGSMTMRERSYHDVSSEQTPAPATAPRSTTPGDPRLLLKRFHRELEKDSANNIDVVTKNRAHDRHYNHMKLRMLRDKRQHFLESLPPKDNRAARFFSELSGVRLSTQAKELKASAGAYL